MIVVMWWYYEWYRLRAPVIGTGTAPRVTSSAPRPALTATAPRPR